VTELWVFRSVAEGIGRIYVAAFGSSGLSVNMAVHCVSLEMVVVILDWEENCWFLRRDSAARNQLVAFQA
jgi:hypothetical protein